MLSRALLASFALTLAAPALTAQTPPPAAATAEEKIKGLEIERPGGGKLGVELVGVSLRATFYDKNGKLERPDAVRITARWLNNGSKNAVLLPAGESVLVSPPVVRPPHNFVVTFVLVGEGDRVIETHTAAILKIIQASAAAE